MEVHSESSGNGTPVIFFHGWGMHSGLFRPVADELKSDFNVVLVDLPGHGLSQPFGDFADIDKCSEYLFAHLQSQIKDKVILCGWSTGSLIAQKLAINHPEMVSKLVLVTGTPAFVKKPGWSYAVDGEVLEKFRNDLLSNFDRTLNRFIALQFMKSEGQKDNLRVARELVFSRPRPDLEMLESGLELLKSTDLRDQLSEIQCPVLIINGERDSLVPTTAARYLAEEIPRSKAIIFRSCGHAPFLSHSKQFNQYVKAFLI